MSPIDLVRLPLDDPEQAREFVRDYGYDLDCENDLAEAREVHAEAVDFLRRHLCPAPRQGDFSLLLPQAVANPDDLLELLVRASRDVEDEPLQPWACAVLRVMHAISHANHALRNPFHPEIRAQILGRYRRHLRQDGQGRQYFGDVPLLHISFREEKSRESMILKLLHKPDNLPQSVFDRVGVRMVTPTKEHALAAVRYIRKNLLANFAHLTAGRSRNTLVDPDCVRWRREGLEAVANPHSDADFRSIQFTCQQLIKVDNPTYNLAARMQARLVLHPCQETESTLLEMRGHTRERQLRFFFPYEVQILDEENHLKTESGPASHADYRLRQLRTVRARILGRLLRCRDNHNSFLE